MMICIYQGDEAMKPSDTTIEIVLVMGGVTASIVFVFLVEMLR